MMTVDAAYALGHDGAIGTLRPGKLADLVVLSRNPLAVPVDDLTAIEVLVTMVGGITRHCAGRADGLCPSADQARVDFGRGR